MLRPCLLLSALVACGLTAGLADTIQLKDKAAIVGKVLAEKPDQIAVDIGYTVLVIPRNQIAAILKDETPAPASKSSPGTNHRPPIPRLPKPNPASIRSTPNPVPSAPCSSW